MSPSFLVPLFLLGLAGIVVPVIVHLTRRQRRDVVAFPSLMFLEKIPYQERRRRRIQHWLLLAARAAALALLAVAFARPFLDDPELAAAGAGGPREIVVLLDRSYSMSVGGQWDRGRRAAAAVFEQLGPLDRASLVLFDQGAGVAARSTPDRGRLSAILDDAAVGSGATRYGPALKVAQTILEESGLPRGEVVLVSDFQREGWKGDEGVRLPAGARVTPIDVHEALPENVQVVDVSLAREAVSGRERVTATARVARRGGSGGREVPVSLQVDGQEVQTRTVALDPDDAGFVTFAPFTLTHPHTRGLVQVPDDALTADDARHFLISPGSAVSVLLAEGGAARRDASFFVRRALETSEGGRFRVRVRRSDGLRAVDLETTDVLVLNDVRLDGASAERVRAFLEEGGGVLVTLGPSARWPESAADLVPGLPGAVQERGEGRGGRLGFLDYGHPVFEVFSGPRSGDFSGARFFRARGLSVGDSAAILARFDDGSVALAEVERGRGRLAVWTTTLDAFWNDLALQPVFLPFVHRLVDHLGGRGEAMTAFGVGQVVDLADPAALEAAGLASPGAAGLDQAGDRIALTPSGNTVTLSRGEESRYLLLEERGFYVVRPPGSEPERPFAVAVNVDIGESDLARIDPQELAAQVAGPPTDPAAGPTFEAAELRREDLERRQSLWRYLLVAAFVLLVAETAISNWISRRSSGTPKLAAG